ncbi:Hypothetical predicted protein [Octopus vulgaris]|uniref:Uncharacterized protein n=1 Tax=Octopus vulgaris TaxID=6645 RepID=A0AA36AGW5_OCTVU|nr:Hypothetical predicted protein [Octopus vulgaris]
MSAQKALPHKEKTHENKTIELFDFLSADDRLVTGGSFTLEEIAKEVMHNEEPVESEDDKQNKIKLKRIVPYLAVY